MAALLIAAWEGTVRIWGFEPFPAWDTKELWAQTRQRASAAGKRGVILVGDSRMQLDVNPRVLAKYAGTEPIQLAVDGSPFWPVLEHLAEDDSINGTVIVDITVWKIGPSRGHSMVSEWLEYYRRFGGKRPAAPYYWNLENELRAIFSGHLAYRSIGITPQSMFGRWLEGASPPRNYLKMLPDRSVMADFRKTNTALLYRMRIERQLGGMPVAFRPIPDFDDRLAALERLVRKIQARGGRVVLIYLPRSGEIERIEDVRYPRAVYWDRLARTTSAETLHYADVPALAGYELADGSHLDYRQAISFTAALGSILFPSGSFSATGGKADSTGTQ